MAETLRQNEPADPAGEPEKRSEEEILERLGLKKGQSVTISQESKRFSHRGGESGKIRGLDQDGDLIIDNEEGVFLTYLSKRELTQEGIRKDFILEESPSGGEEERTEIEFPPLHTEEAEEAPPAGAEAGGEKETGETGAEAGQEGGEAGGGIRLETFMFKGGAGDFRVDLDTSKETLARFGVVSGQKVKREGKEWFVCGVYGNGNLVLRDSDGNLSDVRNPLNREDLINAGIEFIPEEGESKETPMEGETQRIEPIQEEAAGEGEEKEEVKKEKKRKMPNEFKEILGEEEAGWEKWQKEQQSGVLKTLEQKTGFSLAFSPEQWTLIKKIITDRFSLVMSARAEEWLWRHRDKAEKQGVDSESKGGAAVDAVVAMGAWNELFEKGDDELERIKLAKRAVDEFSSRDIPPSARFAILEQLEQIPYSENTDEVKKLRVEAFKKWSGREPEIGEESVNQTVEALFLEEVLPKRTEEEVKKLTPNERVIAAECGLSDIDFVMARDAGYKVRKESKHKRWLKWEQRIVWYDPQGEEAENVWGIMGIIRDSWQKKVMSEEEPGLRERARLDLGSAFVGGVVWEKGDLQLRNIYKSLKNDIETQYHTRKIQEAKEGEKAMEEGEEVLEQKGKTVKGFARSILTGEGRFGNLSGSLEDDEETLLEEMRENWGFDITPEQLGAFQKESGFDYNKFSQKKRGLLYFMLRLAVNSFQEAKKVGSKL